ncbi:MAG: alpha/beta hydrolase [Clostridia bacterium]|nr:alpha/beta hydrolase [Clostridia bacterium]
MAGAWRRYSIINHIRIGKGRELLFLHGWGGSIDSFNKAQSLADHFTITIVDLYGFGKTPPPNHPVDLDFYIRGVLALIKHYKMDDIIVIGHSFGGRIAIKLAATCNRVAGLVLADSAGIRPHRGLKYYLKIYAYKLRRLLKLKTADCGSSDYRKLSGAMKKTFINIVNEDLSGIAKNILVPTLLIWGSNDIETPIYMCKKLNKYIAKSKLIVFEGAGHFAYLEQSGRFIDLVREFANGVI